MNKTLTMYKPLLFWFIAICSWGSLSAQEYRTIDGTNNNISNPTWGAAQHDLQKWVSNGYEDGVSLPAGSARPNPRLLSNILFDQTGVTVGDALELSDFIWVFGQFIDHEAVEVSSDPTEATNIPVDFDDPDFNPGGAIPGVEIKMFRSAEAVGTGTDVNNPRNVNNEITSWIDGSAVYGSDQDRATWLRSFSDGKLKVSDGNLLPYNTTTGQFVDPIDLDAPHMADDVGFASRLFVAGDNRANEQPLLIAMHTLFVREHNRLCEEIIANNPGWSDEQIYQHARKIVGGLIQNVAFYEWLPAMGVHLPDYTGYDETTNGTVANVFSAAAFRLGHTLLNSSLMRLDSNGEVIPEGNLTLLHAFFNPSVIPAVGGLDPYFKGMAVQVEEALDCKVIEDVRSFLFGVPGAGGLDLVAININRGRERGLPDFNTIREDLGLTPYTTFLELNPDPATAAELESAYTDLNDIDPWVGMLAEHHMPNALFGETVMEIMSRQFSALRDGDRFYFENDPDLSAQEKTDIKAATLRMIIMRNTGIEIMQENVFLAMPHDSVCDAQGIQADISGTIANQDNEEINNVNVEIKDIYNVSSTISTGANGQFDFADLESCNYYRITPSLDEGYRNGTSILDIVLISRHLIGLQALSSPYQHIAADVDGNGTVSTFDMIDLQRLLLFIDNEFPNNTSWKFVDADYTFNDPQNPLGEDFPEYRISEMLSENELFNFVGIKIGDIDGSANPGFDSNDAQNRDLSEQLLFQTEEQVFAAEELVYVDLDADDISNILAFQFTLDYDEDVLEFLELENWDNGSYSHSGTQSALTVLWNSYQQEATSIRLKFKAKTPGRLSDAFALNSDLLSAEAYDDQLQAGSVELEFLGNEEAPQVFHLRQNQPNPFQEGTNIRFYLPASGSATLTLFGLNGQKILEQENTFSKGKQEINLESHLFSAPGVYYYQLDSAFGSETGKMVKIAK